MCGICGATGTPDRTILHSMTEVMNHRGPDDQGFFVDDKLMLGQCRLSIIDLKTGRQPIYNEDRSIAIVYNGEIYNFRELRKDLEAEGHTFATQSDTEVVVHSYEQYGVECLKRFNGMFAFALYDSNQDQLILARDKEGIKPLYYAKSGGNVVFASEIKSILSYPEIERRLDKKALSYFLTLRYVPEKLTLFKRIKKVLPGHYLKIDRKGTHEICYWRLTPNPTRDNIGTTEVVQVLKRATERHMISDVPVGVYLSGGLDSVSLVAFASELSNQPIETFCMGFGEETDELADARAVAEHFGTAHHETIVDHGLLSTFPEQVWHMDSPKRNLYPYYLAQLARKHVKVVLSGLGGDELFAGYDFRYSTLQSTNPKTARQKTAAYLRTQARDLPSDQRRVYGSAIPRRMHQCAERFLSKYFSDSLPFMEQVLVADFNAKMTYDFLPVDDATSMANSVETRVPFLDDELVDLAFSIPFSRKFKDGSGKLILREALSGRLPQTVFAKKKQGFGPNPYLVYKRELRDYAEKFLPKGRAVDRGLINGNWIKQTLNVSPTPDLTPQYNKIWDCLALEVFLRVYFDDELLKDPTWDDL